MKVIVGLGNPTPRYSNTRHNIGAMTVDRLCKQWGIRLERRNRYALVGQGRVDGQAVALAKPRSFMNLSGEPVAYLQARFRVKLGDMLVVLDDMDLPLGVTRMRPEGGHGGHNGLRSILDTLVHRTSPGCGWAWAAHPSTTPSGTSSAGSRGSRSPPSSGCWPARRMRLPRSSWRALRRR